MLDTVSSTRLLQQNVWFCLDELPISIKYLLEAAVRHCDEFHVLKKDVETILDWKNSQREQAEIPFKPARVILQDFT